MLEKVRNAFASIIWHPGEGRKGTGATAGGMGGMGGRRLSFPIVLPDPFPAQQGATGLSHTLSAACPVT